MLMHQSVIYIDYDDIYNFISILETLLMWDC